MPYIIDGKAISKQIKDELRDEVEKLTETGINACLAVIQVGNDPASTVYVNNKKKACAYVGINSRSYELPEDTSEQTLLDLVQKLNEDPEVNGILVQLPLPKQIDEDKVIRTISPDKDVDGFHPVKPSVFSKNLTFFSKYAIISHATPGAAGSRIKQGVDRIDAYPIPRPVRHPRCHGNAGDHAGTGRGGHRQWRGGAGNQYPVQNLHALSQRTAVPDLCPDLSADRTFSGQTDHAHCPPRL